MAEGAHSPRDGGMYSVILMGGICVAAAWIFYLLLARCLAVCAKPNRGTSNLLRSLQTNTIDRAKAAYAYLV